ncbi:MAG: hypothetical protein LBH12_00660 [Dysgonamonadaceae bacterium]|jgi:hypothetical protein|nr:hypothetical protein [Dysgonamonadaceae bacterium]
MSKTEQDPFREMKEAYKRAQERWDSLTPEQQEAERVKYAAYDERILSEAGYYNDEPNIEDDE